MNKKILSFLTALVILCTVFCACSNDVSDEGKINVVCTVFPQYDWVRNIVGENENVNIKLLLDSGTDLHSYQPTAADIVTISEADIFIYIGGESDKWVEDVLKTAENKNTLVIDLMAETGEENLYCVEAIGEDEHEHEEEDHTHTEDEHIWLSLKNAIRLTEKIKDALCEKDSANSTLYEQNCKNYTEKLSSLDKAYETAITSSSKDTVIFADRFPFIYLVKDYDLNYHAAFSGCSAESEASFETVTRLATAVDEAELSYILITETSDGSVANTVKNSTKNKDQEILTLNSLQSVTKDKLELSYLDVMEDNLNILKKALS